MKIKTLLLLSLLGLFALACQTKQTPTTTTTLTVNRLGTDAEELEIYNIAADIYFKITAETDSVNLDIQQPVFLNLKSKRNYNYVYVKPGEQLKIDTFASSKVLLSAHEPSQENQFLVEYAALMDEQSNAFPMFEIGKQTVDSFLLTVEEKFAPLAALVDKIAATEDISTAFKQAMQLRLTANKGNNLVNYPGIYKYFNKEEVELPADFYAKLETTDFSTPTLLTFDTGREFGKNWAARAVNFDDYASIPEYLQATYDATKTAYDDETIQSYYLYDLVNSNVNFGGGIDQSGEMIEAFKTTVSNQYLNTKLDETVKPWLNLKAGLDAPDFTAQTRTGEAVSLSSLQGKKVYIDVWATWCGPCIREIPALKTLEKELHDENIEFVSVSIDKEKDREKWLKMVEEKELAGTQLMAQGDWKSDVTTAYNIKGIPRFLLIDEAGKIVSANAPRPSAENIKEVLLN